MKDRKGQKKPCAIFKFRSADDPQVQSFQDPKEAMVDKTSGLSEVKLEHEFQELFNLRPNDRNFNWRTVEFVQGCVKDG